MFRLEVVLKGTDLQFSPAMAELEAIINRLIVCIVESAHSLPRVIVLLIYTYVCVCTFACAHIHAHIHTRTYTHTQTHTYTHKHTHTHTHLMQCNPWHISSCTVIVHTTKLSLSFYCCCFRLSMYCSQTSRVMIWRSQLFPLMTKLSSQPESKRLTC